MLFGSPARVASSPTEGGWTASTTLQSSCAARSIAWVPVGSLAISDGGTGVPRIVAARRPASTRLARSQAAPERRHRYWEWPGRLGPPSRVQIGPHPSSSAAALRGPRTLAVRVAAWWRWPAAAALGVLTFPVQPLTPARRRRQPPGRPASRSRTGRGCISAATSSSRTGRSAFSPRRSSSSLWSGVVALCVRAPVAAPALPDGPAGAARSFQPRSRSSSRTSSPTVAPPTRWLRSGPRRARPL